MERAADQISWMEEDWERRESRTRMALDQSRELQSLASSALSATVAVISESPERGIGMAPGL